MPHPGPAASCHHITKHISLFSESYPEHCCPYPLPCRGPSSLQPLFLLCLLLSSKEDSTFLVSTILRLYGISLNRKQIRGCHGLGIAEMEIWTGEMPLGHHRAMEKFYNSPELECQVLSQSHKFKVNGYSCLSKVVCVGGVCEGRVWLRCTCVYLFVDAHTYAHESQNLKSGVFQPENLNLFPRTHAGGKK